MNGLPANKDEGVLCSLSWSHKTDVGKKREENQDSFCIFEQDNYKLFVVADGMGGAKGGATASKMAVDILQNHVSATPLPGQRELISAIYKANQAIYEKGTSDLQLHGMGTTIVGLLFDDQQVLALNVGDSRAYLIRDRMALQLTTDHTLISELVKSGAISEEQSSNHPVSHMLTRCIGPSQEVDVDCFKINNAPLAGDHFLLCSDGLYNHVTPAEMVDIVSDHGVEQATDKLVDLANQRGGTDNITVILVQVSQHADISTIDLDEDAISSEFGKEVNYDKTIEDTASNTIESADFDQEPLLGLESDSSNKLGKENLAFTSDLMNEFRQAVELDRSTPILRRINWEVLGYKKFLGLGFLLIAGAWFLYSKINTSSELEEAVVASNQVVNQDHGKTVEIATNNADHESPNKVEQKIAEADKSDEAKAVRNQESNVSPLDRARVRMEELEISISSLTAKLASFDQPLSGAVADLLSETTKRVDILKRQITTIEGQMQDVTRASSVLYGQEQRLKSLEVLKVATELSATVPKVNDLKKSFENVTWRYLKEREKIERDPYDKEIRLLVDQLAIERREELEKLGSLLKETIQDELNKVNRMQAQLTIQKDSLEKELKNAQLELNYVHALMSQDPKRRNSMRDSLQQDLNRVKAEYNSLQGLITNSLHGDDLKAIVQ